MGRDLRQRAARREAAEGGDEHQRKLGGASSDLAREGEPVHLGHQHVEDGDVEAPTGVEQR